MNLIKTVSLRKLKSSALDPNPALSAIFLFVSSRGVMRLMRPMRPMRQPHSGFLFRSCRSVYK
jgi:hypothetical protein